MRDFDVMGEIVGGLDVEEHCETAIQEKAEEEVSLVEMSRYQIC